MIAQAANESGWGSSRFAKNYNALFGEYTYNDLAGTIPKERKNGEKHLIKYFSSIDESVVSYFKNINTHHAYSEFRKLRKSQKEKYNFFNVYLLLDKLDAYAEDKNYIQTISSIISVNKLKQLDSIHSFSTSL